MWLTMGAILIVTLLAYREEVLDYLDLGGVPLNLEEVSWKSFDQVAKIALRRDYLDKAGRPSAEIISILFLKENATASLSTITATDFYTSHVVFERNVTLPVKDAKEIYDELGSLLAKTHKTSRQPRGPQDFFIKVAYLNNETVVIYRYRSVAVITLLHGGDPSSEKKINVKPADALERFVETLDSLKTR